MENDKTHILTDQALKEFAEINNKLKLDYDNKINRLEEENSKLRMENNILYENNATYLNELDSLYSMSYWKFRNWRKTYFNLKK